MKLPDEIFSKQEKNSLYKNIKAIKNDPNYVKATGLANKLSDELKKRNASYYRSKLLSKQKFEETKPEIDRYKSKLRFMRDYLEKCRNVIDTARNVIVSNFLDSMNAMGKTSMEYLRDPNNADTVIDAIQKRLENPTIPVDTNSIADRFSHLYLKIVDSNYKNGRKLGLTGGKLDDHLAIQSHDVQKMLSVFENRFDSIKERTRLFKEGTNPFQISTDLRNKAEDLWIKKIFPKLDHDRTFGENIKTDEEKTQFLKDVYRNLTLGKVDIGQISVGANGTSRVLHFLDKKSWHDYHQQYGRGNLFDTLVHTVESGARKIGIAESFGPRSREFYGKIKEYSHENQIDDYKKYTAHKFDNDMDPRFDALTNSGMVPEDHLFVKIMNVTKAQQMMSSLGFSTISSLPDVNFFLNRSFNTGHSYFDRMSFLLKSLIPNSATSQQRRVIAKQMKFLMKDNQFHFQNEFGSTSSKQWPKMMAKYFKLNIQHYWDNYLRTMTAQYYGGTFADMLNRNFNDLSDVEKEMIGPYGIGQKEFNLLKDNKELFKIKGHGSVVCPDAIDNIPHSEFEKYSGKSLDEESLFQTRNGLKRNVASMYYDNSSYVQVTPDNFDKAVFGIQNIPNPVIKSLVNAFMMFKWFGFSSLRKTLYDIYMSKTTEDLLPSMFNADLSTHGRMVSYMSTGIITGLMANSLSSFIKTGQIENPLDHPFKYILSAISAPLGIMTAVVSAFTGDNEFEPVSLLGPMYSMIKDAGDLMETIATFDAEGKRLNYHDRVLKSLLSFGDRHVVPHLAWTNQLYYNHVFNPLMNQVDSEYLHNKYMKQQRDNPNPLYKSDFFGVNYQN